MKAITLTNQELLQLRLLLRDIQLIQKMNSPFDNEAIEILSFKIIEHLNNDDATYSQTEISDEEIEKEAEKQYPYDEKYLIDEFVDINVKGMIVFAEREAWIEGIKWYREQLKNK